MDLFKNIKSDFPASIVVFLVAMPLCLGIALASGAPLFSGIIAGIVGGTVVALLSGSALGVSGPAAGLAVIVLNAINDLQSFEVFLLAVVIAGVFQIILGLIGMGVIAYYFPSSVIKGMLSGIGVLIFFKQIPHAFGYDKDPEGDFAFQQTDGHNTLTELGYMMDNISMGAVIVTLVSLTILILWEQGFMKKLSFTKIIPGPLVAVIASILLGLGFEDTTTLAIKGEHLVSVPISGSISGFISHFTFPDFSQWNNSLIWVTAAIMAIVASLETLLCVEATDKLDPQKRITPTNKELVAQGVGNMVSGLIGGLPITQVIVRSSANIQSGGKSKASAFIHGLLLLGCVLAIPKVLNLIPLACLAAILFVVGYKLAKPALFVQAYKQGWSQFIPFVVTVLGIFFINLLWGIGIGLGLAILFMLYNNYLIPFHVKEKDGETRLMLAEDVSFLNKARIMHTLKEIPENTKLVLDASMARTIHLDVIEIINDFSENAKGKNISIEYVKSDDNTINNSFKQFEIANS